MISFLSKVIFSLGIILIIAAIGSIYVTMIVAQNNGNQGTNSSSSTTPSSSASSPPTTSSPSQQENSSNSNNQSSSTSQSSTAFLKDNTITIPQGAQSPNSGKYYVPPSANVKPNSKITFKNTDSVVHTATANDGSFNTGNIPPGSSKTITVKGQGTIPYHCTIHPWMKAKLTISSSTNNNNNGVGSNSGSAGSNAPNISNSTSNNNNITNNQQGSASLSKSSSASGFQYRTSATAFKILSTSKTDLGLEKENKDNWITANHDIHGTRHSLQTTIDTNNVKDLKVKWILNSQFPIETPPLIVGEKGYAQNNAMQVISFDVNTGLNLWKFDPGVAAKQTQTIPRGVFSHGITYSNGIIFAPTGANGTVVSLNASDGKLLWQSAAVGDPTKGYRLPSPPIVWKDYVIAGSALGDEPPFAPAAKGSITAFNRTNGEKIWNISTVTGEWVSGKNATINGGGTVWSGGSLDPLTGILYVPAGNASPDFDPTPRPAPNPYTNSILAIDVKTGHILWHTQTTPYNTHDWDTAWGTSLSNVTFDNGTIKKIVIGQNKLGNAFALDTSDGHVVWNKTLGVQFRTNVDPKPFGSGTVWPGTQYGIEAYNANDGNKSYFAISNMGVNYFKDKTGTSGYVKPVFDSINNGLGNGTIAAVDIKTGDIKWKYNTDFPTWVSPLVTNGIVFSGHITDTGKPYETNNFGAPSKTPLIPSGIIMALDTNSGKKLWEFNVGAPIGIGGPSIGHGMLFVTTGSPGEISSNLGGYITAFGLPSNNNSSSFNYELLNSTVSNSSTGNMKINSSKNDTILNNDINIQNNKTSNSGSNLNSTNTPAITKQTVFNNNIYKGISKIGYHDNPLISSNLNVVQ